MAQRIRVLGNDGDTTDGAASSTLSSGPRQELLQRRIHSTSTAFLKENILSLSKLPTSQELKDMQERRKLEAEARLAAEKEASRQAEEHAAEILRRRDQQKKDTPKTTPVRSASSTPLTFSTLKKKHTEEVLVDTGWGVDSSTFEISETDDPMVQQMNIIRNFIRQAREADRYDEVATLEANLRELQEEFKKQQRLMNP
ncbi:rabenosyn-5-like [Macrobrachium nipponense]